MDNVMFSHLAGYFGVILIFYKNILFSRQVLSMA
jgi:hypothetical protein